MQLNNAAYTVAPYRGNNALSCAGSWRAEILVPSQGITVCIARGMATTRWARRVPFMPAACVARRTIAVGGTYAPAVKADVAYRM